MRTRSHRPRIRGPKPYPPVRLTAEFVDAVRTSGHAMGAMATVAGFCLPHFSSLLYTDRVPGTPLLVRRLTTLAAALHFPPSRVLEVTR